MKNPKNATNVATKHEFLTEVFTTVSNDLDVIKFPNFVTCLSAWLNSLPKNELPKYLVDRKPNMPNIREFFAPKQETTAIDFSDFETEIEKPVPKQATKKQPKQKEVGYVAPTPAEIAIKTATKKQAEQPVQSVKPKKQPTNVMHAEPVATLPQYDKFGFPILAVGDVANVWCNGKQPVKCEIIRANPEVRMYSAKIIGTPISDRLHAKHIHSIVSYVDNRYTVPAQIFAKTGDPRTYKSIEMSMNFNATAEPVVATPNKSEKTASKPQAKKQVSNDLDFDSL